MYLDSSPAATRRSPETPRRRGDCQADATARQTHRRPPPRARRTRLDDAIVAQWLLDQLPSDHRHSLAGASRR